MPSTKGKARVNTTKKKKTNKISRNSKLLNFPRSQRLKLALFALVFAAIGGYVFLRFSYAEVASTLDGVRLSNVTVTNGSGGSITELKIGEPALLDTSPNIEGVTSHSHSGGLDDPYSGALTDVNAPTATTVSTLYDLCTGFAQPRIPMEAHAWWFPTVLANGTVKQPGRSLGHAHTIACFPYNQTLKSESLDLKINIMAHLANIPIDKRDLIIRVHEIQIRGKTNNGADVPIDLFLKGSGASNTAYMVCDFSLGNDCSTTVPVTVDLVKSPRIPASYATTDGFTSNGRKQLRITSVHEVYEKSTGKLIGKMRAISRAPFTLELPEFRSGPAAKTEHYTTDGGKQMEASGWFVSGLPSALTHVGGYSTPNLLSPLQTDAYSPTGTMNLNLKLDADPCTECITKQEPLQSVTVHLDPVFPDSQGTVLYRETFLPGVLTAKRNLSISLAELNLRPGLHKIVIKLKQPMANPSTPVEHQSTNQGSLHIPFIVR